MAKLELIVKSVEIEIDSSDLKGFQFKRYFLPPDFCEDMLFF